MRRLLAVLFFIFFTVTISLRCLADSRDSKQLADSWINSIHDFNASSHKSCQSPAQSETCPKTLSDFVADDSKNSLMGLLKSDEKSCSIVINKSVGYSPTKLLKIYEANEPELQDPAVIASLGACGKRFPEQQANKMISKYFTNQKRLEKASLSYVSELAAIDSILNTQKRPQPDLKKVCSQSSFGNVLRECDFYINKCSPKVNIQNLVNQTSVVLEGITDLKNEIKKLTRAAKQSTSALEKKSLEEKMNLLNIQLKMKEQIVPWINGQKFKRQLKANHSIADAIFAQLKENRTELIKMFEKAQAASRCFRGSGDHDCSPKSLRKTLTATPALPDVVDFKRFKSKDDGYAYYEYESYQKCILDRKTDQDETGHVISSATRDAAISLATLGLGSLATAARSGQVIKDLAQLGMATSQAHFFVSDAEKMVNECLHTASGLESGINAGGGGLQCPQPTQNISRALEFDSCFKQSALTLVSAGSLGVIKFQALKASKNSQPLQKWAPKNEGELKKYFFVHNREVNKNASKMYRNNSEYFTHIAPKHLKSIGKHDLEKFLSFDNLSKNYNYKGVPKEIIDGLTDKQKYASLLSKDGKNVEMSVSDVLYVLWGHSPENISVKIKSAKNATERLHWESMLKLRNFIVASMSGVDEQIMGSIYKNTTNAQGRVELKFIEMLSDLAARKANPITQAELGRPVINTYGFLQKMGASGIIKKISDSGSEEEKLAAKQLVERIGMPEIQRMSEELERGYQSSGLPTKLKYSVMSFLFSYREKL